MTRSFMCAVGAAAIAFAAFTSSPALAQAKTAKACEGEWKAGKADIQKSGQKKKDFIAQCRGQSAAATDTKADKKADKKASDDAKKAAADDRKKAAAEEKKARAEQKAEQKAANKPAASTTGTRSAVEKPAPAPKSSATGPEGQPGRQAMIARERACGADWKADKAAGKTGTLTWPQYWSDCNKRKKAQGM